ncbi:MAG: restriction endonuclease subunit S [Bacteroidetes bacterium]|nr:restriction endonuclease subunit S [Bacteroidota bacterium]
MKKVFIKDITNNLDNLRKPLNQQERDQKTVYGLYPYIGANNIQGYIDEFLFDMKILCISEDGGSWGANQICAKIYNEKCWVNNHAHVLIEKNEDTNLEYLMHYLNFTDLNSFITGTTRGKLTKAKLESIQIPLPSLATQKAIAEKLDKADALRKKDQELLAQYDELAQSIFIEMFGDPVKNEKGWEVMIVDKITLPIKNLGRETKPDYIEYVDISSVDNIRKKIVSTTSYKIDKRPSRAQQILKAGDVLLSTVRPNLKNIAVNNCDGFIGSTGFFVFRCKNELIDENFLFEFLNSDSVTSKFEGMVSGANYPALKASDIRNFNVILPPLSLQTAFAEMIKNIEAQKVLVKSQAQQSEDLFQALLQESFSF